MQNFRGRVAVITGGASGIGFGLAERFASEGMKLVLADVEERAVGRRRSGSDRLARNWWTSVAIGSRVVVFTRPHRWLRNGVA